MDTMQCCRVWDVQRLSCLNINCLLSTNSGNSPAFIFLGTFPFQIAGCYEGNGSYNNAHAYLGLITCSDEI